MSDDLRKSMRRTGASFRIISVEVPQWPDKDGKPSVVKFRTNISVADVGFMRDIAGLPEERGSIELFRQFAIDDDHAQLVKPDDEWFENSVDGYVVVDAVQRSGLAEELGKRIDEGMNRLAEPGGKAEDDKAGE